MELIEEVAQAGEPLFLAEQPSDSRYQEDINSLALLPIKTTEGIVGVMLLAWAEPNSLSAATRRLLTVFVDLIGNTLERARILETLEQQVADRTRDLSVLYQVTSVVSAHRDLGSITDNALDEILLAVNANLGSIHFRSPDGSNFRLVSQSGIPVDLLDELRVLPVGGHFIGSIIESNEPLVIMDYKHDPKVPEALLQLDCQVYIGTPIRIRGQIQGVLSVYLETTQQYNTDNVRLLMMVVDQLGIALERAQLQAQAEEAVVMEERQRLARELHDAVTQSLYSLTLMADAARKFNDQTMWARSEHYLRMVQSTAKDALKEMRLLVFDLRPTALEEEGFVNALRQRLETVESRARVETRFDVEEIVAPEIEVQVALYRIAQEALNNALKHSQATSMTVKYFAGKDKVSLSIKDNGRGFDPSLESGGIGMRSMRERAEKIGGEFSVMSSKEAGTSIIVSIQEIG
jgi:signal transduction histidine kinase